LKRSISLAVSISDSTPGNGNASTVLHKFTTLRQLVIVTDALADVDKKHLKRERRCAYCTLFKVGDQTSRSWLFVRCIEDLQNFTEKRCALISVDFEFVRDSSAIA
jgi:hypothetical protein